MDLAFAVFAQFYHLDPLALSWGRFRNMWDQMQEVNGYFEPVTPLQMALRESEAEIKAEADKARAKKRAERWKL